MTFNVTQHLPDFGGVCEVRNKILHKELKKSSAFKKSNTPHLAEDFVVEIVDKEDRGEAEIWYLGS